ncbi:hypothetical protein [Halalkalicoccus salilacus]|uniref:hypothetical protein n=1 Tax=Halalkalicoccus TaxID=332246 RepID=UPI002F96D06F
MSDYEMHEPDYSDTTEEDWGDPQLNDFETDDLGEVADHFVLSSSGFPPENFSDLKVPVVDPEGNLNLNALQTAHGGAHSVEAIDDVDEGTAEDVKELLEKLARQEFDHELGD